MNRTSKEFPRKSHQLPFNFHLLRNKASDEKTSLLILHQSCHPAEDAAHPKFEESQRPDTQCPPASKYLIGDDVPFDVVSRGIYTRAERAVSTYKEAARCVQVETKEYWIIQAVTVASDVTIVFSRWTVQAERPCGNPIRSGPPAENFSFPYKFTCQRRGTIPRREPGGGQLEQAVRKTSRSLLNCTVSPSQKQSNVAPRDRPDTLRSCSALGDFSSANFRDHLRALLAAWGADFGWLWLRSKLEMLIRK